MRYIQIKDGTVIDLKSKEVSSYLIVDEETAKSDEYCVEGAFIQVYYYDQDIGEHIEYDDKGGRSMDNWYLKDIIKQANTIEELIDEYVIWKEGDKPVSIPKERKDLINMVNVVNAICKHVKCWLRGAIWTDKGLIYVAKMNEKGELELL